MNHRFSEQLTEQLQLMVTVFWWRELCTFYRPKAIFDYIGKIERWCHQSISFVMVRHWSKFQGHSMSRALEATAIAFFTENYDQ